MDTILESLVVPTSSGIHILTSMYAVVLGFVVVICIEQYIKRWRDQSRSYPLPPGPLGLPWVGNVIGIDASVPWVTYSKWAKKYGDLIYSRLLGKDIIIVNSERVTRDLLDHRAGNYSNRPYLVTNELCGIDFNTGFLPYGDTWRLHRRFFRQTFSGDAVQLLDTPEQHTQHVFDYTSSIILNSVYNYDPTPRQDEITEIIAKVSEVVMAAIQPEVALIIGAFPGLLYLPSWFPGMSFMKRMEVAKKFASRYVERPFEYSVQKLNDGGSVPSMVHDAVRKAGLGNAITDESSEVWMTELKNAAATAFLGAVDSSNAVIMTFFLMMVLNPEAQEKAQAEIDLVLGGDRLPTIGDRPSLPYVDAILRETYRYNPITPLLTPHSVLEDDIYSGFRIPKGAVVLANLWSMAHDESKYPNPDKFIPERFLADDGSLLTNDTEHLAFGIGRRVCPGRHFADASIWSVISSLLTVFHISKAKDANGVEILVEPKFSTGLVVHPLPFACRIVPRNPGMDKQKLEQLIATTTAMVE